jgi:hypothetical protein
MASFTFNTIDFSGTSYGITIGRRSYPLALANRGGHHPAANANGRAVHTNGGRNPGVISVPCWIYDTTKAAVDTKLANIRNALTPNVEGKLLFSNESATIGYFALPQSFDETLEHYGTSAKFDLNFALSHVARFSALEGAQNVHTSGQSKNYTMAGNEYSPRAVLTMLAHAGATGSITIANTTTGESVVITDGLANGETLIYNTWYQTALVGTTDRRADLVGMLTSLKYGTNAITATTANGVALTLTVQAEGAYNP